MAQKRKLVGVVAAPINNKSQTGLNSAYIEFLKIMFNTDVVIIDATSEKFFEDLDLLLLPGGADVDTSRYNRKPSRHTQRPNIYYEWFDTNMLGKYIDANIPIFGICRGFQTLSVYFGCTLSQHISQAYSENRYELVDTQILNVEAMKEAGFSIRSYIKIKGNSKLKAIKTNSMHHQGLRDENIPQDSSVIPLAYNHSKNNIEAMTIEGKPIIAVQWHPKSLGL